MRLIPFFIMILYVALGPRAEPYAFLSLCFYVAVFVR